MIKWYINDRKGDFMLIDLHVHSNISDGTLTPSGVVELAVKNGISAIALTDHDTIDGIPEASKSAMDFRQKGNVIELIPGTELSVSYKKRDIHILGLFLDVQNPTLINALKNARIGRDERNEKMAANLRNAGINITIDMLQKSKNDVITRAHFAKFLAEQGFVKSPEEAFQTYINSKSPYYVPREYFSPSQAIELIHKAKGFAIIAHPLLYHFNDEEVEEMVFDFTHLGIDGIEAIYSLNTEEDEAKMLKLAKKYNLLVSGGTDYHGDNKPDLELGFGRGNMRIPYSILEKFKEIGHSLS